MPFFRQRPQRLGKKIQFVRLNGKLTRPGPEDFTFYTDEIAKIEILENRKLISKSIFSEVDLQPRPFLLDMQEPDFAVAAKGNNPAAD